MADDSSKFGIEVSIDTKDASKKLDDLNKKAEKTNKSFNEKHEFKADTKEAEAGLKNVNDKLENIENSLDNVEQKADKAFSVGKLIIWYEVLKKVAGVAISVANYVTDAAKEMTSLSNTAAGLSISTNTLKAWETTFRSMGFDAKQADAALGNIQDRITGQLLNPSMQVASTFSMMGVNLRKANGELRNADDVLSEIFSKFKNLKPEYAIAIGAQLGISRDQVMQAIKNPNYAKTLAEQKANPVVTSPEETAARNVVESNAKLTANIDKTLNAGLMPLNDTLTNKILPPLTKIADVLTAFAGPAVQTATHVIASRFKIGGPEALLKEGISKGAHVLSEEMHKATNYISTAIGKKELERTAQIAGMTPVQVAAMMQIAGAEDATFSNKKSGIADSSANGFFQITKKTMAGLAKNNAGFNPEDWSTVNQIRAYSLLRHEFQNYAKGHGIDPNSTMQYRAFHNLGQGNYEKALQLRQNNPNMTYGQAYNAIDPSGKMTRDNKGLASQRFPSEGLFSPTAAQSSSITNNLVNNNSSSNVSSSTTIGAVHVSANNPQEFAKQLADYKYLDRVNNMIGQLA